MRKSTDAKVRQVTPPSPSFMSNDEFARFLAALRTNRTTRPGGARPQPTQPARASAGRCSLDSPSSLQGHQRTLSQAPSFAGASISSSRGRDYYPTRPTAPMKPSQLLPTATYMERGQRWMEKEEAVSLREAMEDMDIRTGVKEASEDQGRVHSATAHSEAVELVWRHQHQGSAPRPDGPYRYRPHLRRNSYAHARTASLGKDRDAVAPTGLGRNMGSPIDSGGSSEIDASLQAPRQSTEPTQLAANAGRRAKPYGSVGASHRRTSLKRNISGEVERPFSGDQIWEEPEASSSNIAAFPGRASPDKLSRMPQSPMTHARLGPWREEPNPSKPPNPIEIHRNPPSQSRDPHYTTNTSSRAGPDPSVERKNGVEVPNPDIRAATTKKLKDRNSKLPEPTAVSDSPGRPIVSFDANWKAPDESADVSPDRPAHMSLHDDGGQSKHGPVDIPRITVAEGNTPLPRQTPCAGVPSVTVTGPHDAPKSSVPRTDMPTIEVDEAPVEGSIPCIVTPEDKLKTRPLPTPRAPGSQACRIQPPRGHWSPAPGTTGRPAAICHECGLPVVGRFVALVGFPERFHPRCFSCFACGTSLEAMEISPEPDHVRAERLERIRRRAAGDVLEGLPGMTAAEDGDERLRFYCHLDWHELFAPRCKHCKTPIIGEHIVALGEHWHYGHFFCAECGDPFDHGMTHMEKDGYAWCINCQTKRTERRAPKCEKCKAAVIGRYIQALGGEWHEHCFRCAECQSGFDDGQIFPKKVQGELVVLCTACRTRELKS